MFGAFGSFDEAARGADRRQSREGRAHGEHVGQIHLERVVRFFAQAKWWYGTGGHRHDVDLFKGLLVIIPQ